MNVKTVNNNLILLILAFFSITAFAQSAGVIDLNNLENYANQPVPNYINKDNTPPNNQISDAEATLGRVLFYDKKISVNNTIACASCHQQAFAFSDTAMASTGVNGTTGRHSMRLINARFANEAKFFWDERAASLEAQTTMPIQDHAEMGFSGENGDPVLDSLLTKLMNIDYYNDLFTFAYGDSIVTETRMQRAMAQFIRSIQSFDSKYDAGRSQVPNDPAPFPNFTLQENQGKQLFLAPPVFDPNGNRIAGGAGCAGCHAPPEFDIDPNTRNNGEVAKIGGGTDFTNTRTPSLRDMADENGSVNGGMMHNASKNSLLAVVNHYNQIQIVAGNNLIDPRLTPNGNPQNLNLSEQEKQQLVAFMRTLTGSDVYSNPKWSNPFDSDGNLTVILPNITAIDPVSDQLPSQIELAQNYPNPFNPTTTIRYAIPESAPVKLTVFDVRGKIVAELVNAFQNAGEYETVFDAGFLASGIYFYRIQAGSSVSTVKKMMLVK